MSLPGKALWYLLLLLSHFSHVGLLATPWTVAYQAPPSMGFSRQQYWNGVPFPSPLIPEGNKMLSRRGPLPVYNQGSRGYERVMRRAPNPASGGWEKLPAENGIYAKNWKSSFLNVENSVPGRGITYIKPGEDTITERCSGEFIWGMDVGREQRMRKRWKWGERGRNKIMKGFKSYLGVCNLS